jgi:hypothetical protein
VVNEAQDLSRIKVGLPDEIFQGLNPCWLGWMRPQPTVICCRAQSTEMKRVGVGICWM